ncbi:MAG TPA: DinB family protein [Candidatus Angelobacter sp.]|nr:DinB family protein [Candidatus Angelobacter sp.]
MNGIPARSEAAPYYFTYIDRISSPDILGELERQLQTATAFLQAVSEDKSLFRYGPDKWSIREVWNHVNDCERMFAFRAFWFARGFPTALPSFEQEIAAVAAESDRVPWAQHIEEFQLIRRATLALFRHLPPDAWKKTGTASGNAFTVRALAYIAAGHVEHHLAILRERYLRERG